MSHKMNRYGLSVSAGILCATTMLLPMLCHSTWAAESPVDSEDAVRLRRVKSADQVSLFIENWTPCEVTVTLRVLTKNARVSRVKPETATYPPMSETEAARISASDRRQRWKWRCRYNWVPGRLRTRHDRGALYLLPFEEGRSYRVVQGYQGASTHHGRDEYAIDFGMRKGTPVSAPAKTLYEMKRDTVRPRDRGDAESLRQHFGFEDD